MDLENELSKLEPEVNEYIQKLINKIYSNELY